MRQQDRIAFDVAAGHEEHGNVAPLHGEFARDGQARTVREVNVADDDVEGQRSPGADTASGSGVGGAENPESDPFENIGNERADERLVVNDQRNSGRRP